MTDTRRNLPDGYVVVCADGKVRHPPYLNESDAMFDAALLDRRRYECPCASGGHTHRAREGRDRR